MVYALKSYNNNRPYRRRDDRSNVLDILIQKFAKESTAPYTAYPQKKSFVDKSVQNLVNNSIIEGYFPKENVVRQMAIKRVNKMLCILISLLITVVVVSYYFVISCEVKLNDLISCRGFGRLKLIEIGKVTKKNRIVLSLEVYK